MNIKKDPLFYDSPFWSSDELYDLTKGRRRGTPFNMMRPVYRELIRCVYPMAQPVSTCVDPICIYNPIYKMTTSTFEANYKEWSEDPDAFEARNPFTLYVPCRKCPLCLKRKGSDWRVRMYHEFSANPVNKKKHNYFVTLTFNEDSYKKFGLPYGHMPDRAVLARPIRLFLDRYRKAVFAKFQNAGLSKAKAKEMAKKYGICRHFFVWEHSLENTQRLHIHGIIYSCIFTSDELAKIWSYGFIDAQDATDGKSQYSADVKDPAKTVNYILKYLVKGYKDEHGKPCVSPVFVSPGLGRNFIRLNKLGFINKYNEPIFTISLNDPNYRFALPKYYQQFVWPKNFVKDYMALSPPIDYRCGKFSTSDHDEWRGYVMQLRPVQEYFNSINNQKPCAFTRRYEEKTGITDDDLWEFFQTF